MAIKRIKQKIENEKYLDQMQRMWVQENRQFLRDQVRLNLIAS